MFKTLLRQLARRAGYELVHHSEDVVLHELLDTYRELRLSPNNALRWDDRLPRAAAQAHVRHLIRLHTIDLVIDVGANEGQFGSMLRKLGYTGEIVSFEPANRARAQLTKVAEGDARWHIRPQAVGRIAGQAELQVYADNMFSSLHKINDAGAKRFGDLVAPGSVEMIDVVALDDIWAELTGGEPRRVFLKTDTQGHDLEVVMGTTLHMGEVFAALTEASVIPIYERSPRFPEILAFLGNTGLQLSGVFPISHEPQNLSLIEMDCAFTRAAASDHRRQ
jgi:FkbM family methyltransferase